MSTTHSHAIIHRRVYSMREICGSNISFGKNVGNITFWFHLDRIEYFLTFHFALLKYDKDFLTNRAHTQRKMY